ncbi:hypothetical protein HRI_001920300 [Hibiscus trionum]|uniref:Uncharacterized protein n=1 Tax=Hibiscus trionum TaxID=183268 RepID=A0A9W7HV59_HIBTR|nr:hypothetical protein HRI_001920300 [Hibiscus trionum]
MVRNSEAIKTLQESHNNLQKQLEDQARWNENTDRTLDTLTRHLTTILVHLGLNSTGKGETMAVKGKAKVKIETEDVFPFAPRPAQVELPIFIGADLEEWIASAQDFFEFYRTEDHHRLPWRRFAWRARRRSGTVGCSVNDNWLAGNTSWTLYDTISRSRRSKPQKDS